MVEVCGIALEMLPSLNWMPSRIPIRDALVVFVAEGADPPPLPYESSESRWYPVQGGHRLAIPYDGQPLKESAFQLQEKLWDHTTCDRCVRHIPAMTLCYVTESGTYIGLCFDCYETLVARKVGPMRSMIWRMKRLLGNDDAA
jgi:hypothetical protein